MDLRDLKKNLMVSTPGNLRGVPPNTLFWGWDRRWKSNLWRVSFWCLAVQLICPPSSITPKIAEFLSSGFSSVSLSDGHTNFGKDFATAPKEACRIFWQKQPVVQSFRIGDYGGVGC